VIQNTGFSPQRSSTPIEVIATKVSWFKFTRQAFIGDRGMSSKRLGWGIIGASNIAREWVIPAIKQAGDSEVVALLSSDARRAEAYAAENDIPDHYSDGTSFFNDPRIDVVYVCTTNERHASDTLAAAAAGKHVLCEKPMALTEADARLMIEACRKASVVLSVNHHMRCMETHRSIREIVRSGRLGMISLVRFFFGIGLTEEEKRWRAHDANNGAGVLFDLTVHDADLLRFLFDDDLDAIACMTGSTGSTSPDVEDNAMLMVRMKSGLMVQIAESFNTPHAHTKLEIHGTQASLIAEDVLLQKGGGTVCIHTGGIREMVVVEELSPYARVVRDLNSAVRGNGAPAASADDGYKSLVAVSRAREAAATGRIVSI
jgi:1,5-anhydro-D-fructose reductase (1,5-anhydro-D-mannitol-forming)